MIITGKIYNDIKDLARQVVAAKMKNPAYKRDSHKLYERYLRGFCGEYAVEQLLGLNIIEWKAETYGAKFEHPDIVELGIGVKSYDLCNFPLIYRQNDYPQIFVCVTLEKEYAIATIKGLATVDVLNTYQDDRYVLDKRALWKKTAFVGFDYLIPLEGCETIEYDGKKIKITYINKH